MQCTVTLMYQRDFGLVVAKKVNGEDLWSNYLILTRSVRLSQAHGSCTDSDACGDTPNN